MKYSLERMIQVAIAMSAEKDTAKLLDLILTEAMNITNCDGGTVYIREEDGLHFYDMVTLSKGFHKLMTGSEDIAPPVPMTRSHVCACAAIDHKRINIEDIYTSDTYDFSGAEKYDRYNNYRTQSMLVIPMEDEKGRNIGVMQLINAKDAQGNVIPFEKEWEELIAALASLAAVILNNNRLGKAVSDILHSFVTVMVDAVDARSSYNANHTRSMVRYGERFIEWLDRSEEGWKIPEAEKDPFLMSIWLHDIGKLIIPLEIMDKATRLGSRKEVVLNRIETAMLMERIRVLTEQAEAYKKAQAGEPGSMTAGQDSGTAVSGPTEAESRLARARELILEADGAGFLTDEMLAELNEIGKMQIQKADGTKTSLLNEEELTAITVRRGTLTAGERREIERHVEYTGSLLSKMVFEGDYERVPAWASMHHELLNGSGYPNHVSGKDIPDEVRLLTILDVYDALTAEDRPYKPPMPPEKAFAILKSMCGEGKIDARLLDMFERSEAWKKK